MSKTNFGQLNVTLGDRSHGATCFWVECPESHVGEVADLIRNAYQTKGDLEASKRESKAAPELLEALKYALTWAEEQRTIEHEKPDNDDNQKLMDDICREARAAISKAEGKE